MTAYPPVAFCELRPFRNSHKYWAQFEIPYQPPQTTQKNKPAKKGGLWLTRTTTVLNELNKHELYQWYAKCAADWWKTRIEEGWSKSQLLDGYWDSVNAAVTARDRSAHIGTLVHRVIEEFLVSGCWPDTGDLPAEALHALACWQEWWSQAGLLPVAVEVVCWSLSMGLAGTIDLLARDEAGRLHLVDWKTSSSIHTEHLWQQACYAACLREMGWEVPEVARIVRIPKRLDQPHAEWCTCWQSPDERQALEYGFRSFVLGLSLRPSSVRIETFDGAHESENAEGLFDTDEDLEQAQQELDELFAFR